jgi:hypothetical protein
MIYTLEKISQRWRNDWSCYVARKQAALFLVAAPKSHRLVPRTRLGRSQSQKSRAGRRAVGQTPAPQPPNIESVTEILWWTGTVAPQIPGKGEAFAQSGGGIPHGSPVAATIDGGGSTGAAAPEEVYRRLSIPHQAREWVHNCTNPRADNARCCGYLVCILTLGGIPEGSKLTSRPM